VFLVTSPTPSPPPTHPTPPSIGSEAGPDVEQDIVLDHHDVVLVLPPGWGVRLQDGGTVGHIATGSLTAPWCGAPTRLLAVDRWDELCQLCVTQVLDSDPGNGPRFEPRPSLVEE
jgi:hypothetical protein